ncbi:MAG: hypothetical protein OHK003_11280 [Anaerolineales bacterium]
MLTIFTYLPLSVILSPMPKYYTPAEANNLLEIVRPMVGELMEIGERIRSRQPEIWLVVEKSAGNGGNPELSKMLPDFDRLDAILHRLQDMDIQVKDLSTGLIDFLAVKDGRAIYLCWKYGEGSIQFWHEIEAGFAGRQPIDWE